jgi:hypothetical protein
MSPGSRACDKLTTAIFLAKALRPTRFGNGAEKIRKCHGHWHLKKHTTETDIGRHRAVSSRHVGRLTIGPGRREGRALRFVPWLLQGDIHARARAGSMPAHDRRGQRRAMTQPGRHLPTSDRAEFSLPAPQHAPDAFFSPHATRTLHLHETLDHIRR